MDFTTPERLAGIAARVREVIDNDVIPLEVKLGGGFRALLPSLNQVRKKVKTLGLWAPHLPASLGGMGLSLTEHARVCEEMGRSALGNFVFNCQAPDVGNMELLHAHGTTEQKHSWLAPLAQGDVRSCFSMTEPDRPGSNPTWLDTRAVLENGAWVINGRKWFTSSAEGARFAIVMAVTDPDAPPHKRASQIIVPLDTPGFRLVRNVQVMGDAGEDWMSHAEVTYENCRVPEANLLGARGAGFALAQERLGPGRIHHCMRWIGICERAFDLMCARAVSRELAPGVHLGEHEIVEHWIAESRASIDAARLMVMRAAWTIEREGAKAARDDISLIKFFVAKILGEVLDRAIQAHGALGLTDDTPLAGFWRHERAARIYDGADEVHKHSVARRILERYARHSSRSLP